MLLFDDLRLVALALTPLLIIAALWLSRHRRRTLLQLATGSVLLLVVVRRLTMRATEAVVDLPPQAAGQRAARVVADQVLDGLYASTEALIIVGLVLIVIALLTGPYRWAVAGREPMNASSTSDGSSRCWPRDVAGPSSTVLDSSATARFTTGRRRPQRLWRVGQRGDPVHRPRP